MRTSHIYLLTCLIIVAGFLDLAGDLKAEMLSVGVKGGVPVTDAVESGTTIRSEARPYTVGPMVQISLPFSFAVEVDALYKRTGYSVTGSSTVLQVRANSWEFPMLAKYYLPGYDLPVRPYAEVGYVVRHLSGVEGNTLSVASSITSTLNTRNLLRDDPTNGIAMGGGVELRARRLRLTPEVRYTHWAGRAFDFDGIRSSLARSTDNQVEFLVGIRF